MDSGTPAREPLQLQATLGDVQTTMALWQRAGLSTVETWLALTGERRAHVGAGEIYGFMCRWAERPRRLATQLELPSNKNGERSMDWFRSHHGAPTDPKWLVIARRAGVKPAEVAAIFWALLDHASQHAERGSIAGFDIETLAGFYDLGEVEIAAVMTALSEKGLLAGDRIASWSRRQPKREDEGAAERKRLQRERDRAQDHAGSHKVTPGHARTEKIQNRTEREQTLPPLTPPPVTSAPPPTPKPKGAPLAAALSLEDLDLPDDWRQAATADREKHGLAPVDLDLEWTRLRHKEGHRRLGREQWRRRWMGWALAAKSVETKPAEPEPAAPRAPAGPVEHQLGAAGDRLLHELGAEIFRGWFLEVRVGAVADGAVRLVAPTGFVRNWVGSHYDGEIRRAFGVERVEVMTAAELRQAQLRQAGAPAPEVAAPAAAKPAKPGRAARRSQTELLLPSDGGGRPEPAADTVPAPTSPAEAVPKRRAAQ